MPRTPLFPIVPVDMAIATGETKALLDSYATAGTVPNIYRYLVKIPGMLRVYKDTLKEVTEGSGLTPVEQQVVYLTVSHVNKCEFCMAGHSRYADRTVKMPADIFAAVRAGMPIPDPKLQALSAFTRAMVETRGNPDKATMDALLGAGYGEQQVLAVIMVIASKVFTNYLNRLSVVPVDKWNAGYEVEFD